MGQARMVMDAITAAVMSGDADAIAACYAEDAVADTPDAGRMEGREAIAQYLANFSEAFSDMSFETVEALEIGNIAIDEGLLIGRHTGTLRTPDGDIAPTGKQVRIRECDLLAVREGVAVSHRFYYNELDLLAQLGLLDARQLAGMLPIQRVDLTEAEATQPV
ncbi:MAG TPA: ester cyclase [Mycobacteriales bacterium]|nr:ester cyclase [Mycobacteriales bacterium]